MNPEIPRYALFCGLCALIPLPWIDQVLERRARRRLYTMVAEGRGATLDEASLHVLTEDRSSMVLGCLVVAFLWPLKKLFRTFLYVLTLKDVVDGVALAAHRAKMIDLALARGLLPARASEVRGEIDAVLSRWRWSPVSRVLMGHERPVAEWLPVEDGLTGVVGALHRHGGGALVLADFTARLEKLS